LLAICSGDSPDYKNYDDDDDGDNDGDNEVLVTKMNLQHTSYHLSLSSSVIIIITTTTMVLQWSYIVR